MEDPAELRPRRPGNCLANRSTNSILNLRAPKGECGSVRTPTKARCGVHRDGELQETPPARTKSCYRCFIIGTLLREQPVAERHALPLAAGEEA